MKNLTEDEIDLHAEKLKQLHKVSEVNVINVTVGEDVFHYFIKPADRMAVQKAMIHLMREEIIDAGAVIVERALIAGDTDLLNTNTVAFNSVAMQAVGFVEMYNTTTKKK